MVRQAKQLSYPFLDMLTLSQSGGADYAHPLALSHLNFFMITHLSIQYLRADFSLLESHVSNIGFEFPARPAGMTNLGEEPCRGGRGQKQEKNGDVIFGRPHILKQLCFYIVQTFFSDEVLKETAFLPFALSAEGKVRLLWQVL